MKAFWGILALILIIAVIALPVLYYYVKFDEKGLLEERLLVRFIKQHKRSVFGFQTGIQKAALEVPVSFKGLTEKVLKKIKVGDKELLSDGEVLAELVWRGEPDKNYFIVDLGDGAFRKSEEDNKLYSLRARLRLKGVMNDRGGFLYKTKPVKEFVFFTFSPDGYDANFAIEAERDR